MSRPGALGDIGEKIARKYLKRKGYRILDKNFRYSRLGEIDIIAKKSNDIIFFEVKTRRKVGPSEFLPEDNITFNKKRKLIKLAQTWLGQKKIKDLFWQIDILAIEIYRDKSFDIRHLENAIEDFY
jgi:putative endonuclease